MSNNSHKRNLLAKIMMVLTGTAVTAVLLILYGEQWLRSLLLYLSTAPWARELISEFPIAKQVAARFVAGETLDDAMRVTKELNAREMKVTLDLLGESVTNPAEAQAARDEILHLLDRIQQEQVDANVSVKLSQLGLKLNRQLTLDNMRAILQRAQQYGNRVRIDMEDSSVTEETLNIYRTLRDDYSLPNTGVVIQSYLYRSEEDVRHLVEEGAWVRLCKGAYKEPADVAFAHKADTDANYVLLMQMMLNEEARKKGVMLGVATHDEKMIEATKRHVAEIGFPKDAFEFQMLYGVRRDLQEQLVQEGYQVRIYVPYGTAWYPYFMRRLAERPANLWFFLSNLLK